MSHVPTATSSLNSATLTQLTAAAAAGNAAMHTPSAHATPTHLQQLNKLQQLYPPPSFAHPALPIAGVT